MPKAFNYFLNLVLFIYTTFIYFINEVIKYMKIIKIHIFHIN